ncbi:MAG: oligosaccharide flippase family protein [Synergistaceae bacterium]|jgi:O-antigen/teichoic acid export membrane protein|nr:oligosaccharide flippase family protein [Synergistaceae bacterium]
MKISAIMAYANLFVNLLYHVLITPVVIRLYGQSEYGIFSVCTSVIQYLNLFQFGFGTTYMRYFIKFEQQENQRKAEELNGMFLLIYAIIIVVVIVAGIFLVVNIESVLGEKITTSEYATAKKLLVLMLINMTVTLSTTQFTIFAMIREKFVFQKGLTLCVSAVKPFAVLLIVLLGYKSVEVTMFITFLTLFSSVISAWYCFARLKMKFRFSGFDIQLFSEMSSFTFFIFLQQIMDIINWQIDKFLVARFWGAKEAAVYAVGALFCNVYLQFSTAITQLFVPRANRIVAQKLGDEPLSDLLIKTGRIQFFIVTFVMLSFIVFGQSGIHFFVGKGYENVYYVGLFLMLPLIMPLSMNLAIHILRAKAKHKVQSVIYILVAFLNFLVSIPLCRFYGEVGAAFGTFIGMIVANNIIQIIYIQKVGGLDIKRWFREIFSICQSFVIPIVVGMFIMIFIDTMYIPAFLVSGVFFTMVYMGSAWRLGMNAEEKKIISTSIGIIFKNVGKK